VKSLHVHREELHNILDQTDFSTIISPISFDTFYTPYRPFQIAVQSFSTQSNTRIAASATSFREESNHQKWTFLAAAAAAGIAGGSFLALCDAKPSLSEVPKPETVDNESADTKKSTDLQAAATSIQATSTAVDPSIAINAGLEPQGAPKAPVDMGPNPPEHRMSSAEAHLEEATRKAKQHSGGLKVFSGNGNMALALEIARHFGINLGKSTVGRFADGEVNVVIHENVRGKDVYIVQPTGPPVNDNMMELLLMVSTLRRASARRITVVIVSE
jgi:hypothetical protein